ncbi:MAG TPA: PIN domain-containing protein, partial [Thermoanaerobaculia bacterium]|nr:PIN domain-containing protein [Thermoanaerobaculia bacterium]
MRAVDTNVLVRLITRDDQRQVRAAEAFIKKGAWVSTLVLAETAWVLDSVYDLSHDAIAVVIEMLLS